MLHWLLFLKYSQHILKKYENSIEQNNDFFKKNIFVCRVGYCKTDKEQLAKQSLKSEYVIDLLVPIQITVPMF